MKKFLTVFVLTLITNISAAINSFAIDTGADGLFNNQNLVENAINGAINEAAIAGYHGSLQKAEHFIEESKKNQDNPDKAAIASFIAWWNLLEAHLILDEAASMPTTRFLNDQSLTLLTIMEKADKARYKIEKDVFKWSNDKSLKAFQSGFLMIKEKLGISPMQQ